MFSSTPLKEVYEEAKVQVYRELKEKPESIRLSAEDRKKLSESLPPCIVFILSKMPAKTEKINLNKLVMLLVTYFQMAGWTQMDALSEVQSFIAEYPYSETYDLPGKRYQHWNTQWDYLKNSREYSFNCSYVKGLGLPGSAFECSNCIGDKTDKKKSPRSFSSKKVLGALNENEDGDASLYVMIKNGYFCYDHTDGVWYKWEKHFWQKDKKGSHIYAVNDVIDLYQKEAEHQAEIAIKASGIGDEKLAGHANSHYGNLLKRIKALRTIYRKNHVLELATYGDQGLGLTGDEWDQKPFLLACQNGVIDLETGKLHDGQRDQYLKTFCPTNYIPTADPPELFIKFLYEIFDDKKDLCSYIHRLMGYGLIGSVYEHKLPIFWGIGRNGKDTLIQAVSYALGPMAVPVDVEILLEQNKSRSSSNPSPDIIDLRGRRIVWASETSQQRRLNAGKVKILTGGNILKGRNLFAKDYIQFEPSHTPILITNHKPHAQASDYALWQRIHLIPFTLSFVDDPKFDYERKRDPDLPNKLKSESSKILKWLVDGCLEYQRQRLNPPDCVKMATEIYRQDEDIVGHFIDARCVVMENTEVKAGELYREYKEWCTENGYYALNQKNFGIEIKNRFDSNKTNTVHYIGIGLIDASD